jgi:hypothetical protein
MIVNGEPGLRWAGSPSAALYQCYPEIGREPGYNILVPSTFAALMTVVCTNGSIHGLLIRLLLMVSRNKPCGSDTGQSLVSTIIISSLYLTCLAQNTQ